MSELIKCPCCGNTAQPKYITSLKSKDYYNCGCGCLFSFNHDTWELNTIEEPEKN